MEDFSLWSLSWLFGGNPLRAVCLLVVPLAAWAAGPWDLERLSAPPHVYAAELHEQSMRALYYEGLPWKGQPTRVFAWYGVPDVKPASGKFPAIVLVHGGGGTAFADWVKLWNSRGYAALAMDTCGSLPSRGYGEPGGAGNRPRHESSGPPGWDASFDQIDWPVEDQWPYHAVADILLANSLLRSFPEVDANRIGITGISWGGYLTAIAASGDPRFRFAVPVYGCGFLGDNSVWLPAFARLGPEKARKWLGLWDPSVYLPRARMPFLWVAGTNDFAYPLDSLQKSYRLPKSPRTLAIRLRMQHGHSGPGESPEEIHAFADQVVNAGQPLASIQSQRRSGRKVSVHYRAHVPLERAELIYTTQTGKWQDRLWLTVPAAVDPRRRTVIATLPEGVTVYYFNLIDRRGLIVSSEHETV
jgi:dienelactone hydrolase